MNTTHRAALLGTGLAAALCAASPALSQVSLSTRGLGMGNASLASARGQESLFLNPANLGLSGTPRWSVALPQLVAGGTVLGLGAGDLNDLRDYQDLPDDRAREILDGIPEGTGVEYDAKLRLLTVQTGRLAFGVSYNSVGSHSLDRDIVDLALNGYQRGQVYTADNTFGSRATYLDAAVGYGRRFGMVSVGAAAHYYHGRDLVASGVVDVDTVGLPSPDIFVTYSGVRADAGRGFGLDLGAAVQPVPNLTLSASVANLAKSMEWDEDLLARSITLNGNEIENSDFRELRTEYRESGEEYDAFVAGLDAEQRAAVQSLAASLSDRTELPTTLRAGAAYSLPATGTELAASFTDELSDSRISGLWSRSLSAGVEQKLAFLRLRAGISTNLDKASLLSAGLSLGPLDLAVARLDNGPGLGGADREGWVASFGLSTRSPQLLP